MSDQKRVEAVASALEPGNQRPMATTVEHVREVLAAADAYDQKQREDGLAPVEGTANKHYWIICRDCCEAWPWDERAERTCECDGDHTFVVLALGDIEQPREGEPSLRDLLRLSADDLEALAGDISICRSAGQLETATECALALAGRLRTAIGGEDG